MGRLGFYLFPNHPRRALASGVEGPRHLPCAFPFLSPAERQRLVLPSCFVCISNFPGVWATPDNFTICLESSLIQGLRFTFFPPLPFYDIPKPGWLVKFLQILSTKNSLQNKSPKGTIWEEEEAEAQFSQLWETPGKSGCPAHRAWACGWYLRASAIMAPSFAGAAGWK